MKKASFFTLMVVGILALTTWRLNSSKSSSTTTSSSIRTTTMAPVLELAAGTLRLEGTSQAVDKEMATQLLPYWQLMDELNASESTASQETAAVVENIKEIMTTEQMNAIEDMQLSQSDLATVIQDGGTSNSSVTGPSTISNNAQFSPGGGPGLPPDGGGMPVAGGGGITSSGSQQNTSSSQSSSSGVTTSLIEEVITLLKSRIE